MMIGKHNTTTMNNTQTYSAFAVIALCANPILTSLVVITLRNLRSISVHTQAFYHAFALTIGMAIVIMITGDYPTFLRYFGFYDYLLMLSGAFFALMHQLTK